MLRRSATILTALVLSLPSGPASAQHLDWVKRVWSGPNQADPLSAYRSAAAQAVTVAPDGQVVVAVKGGLPARHRNTFDPLWQVDRFLTAATPPAQPSSQLPGDPFGTGARAFGVPTAMALDAGGRAVVAGTVAKLAASEPCCGYDFAVLQLDAGGQPAWSRRVGVDAAIGAATAVAVDRDGAVVAAGFVANGDIPRLTVAKFSAGGTSLWIYQVPDAGRSAARALALDDAGDVIVGGYLGVADTDLFVVALAGADGRERWRYVLDGSATTKREVGLRKGIALSITRQSLAETILSTAHRLFVADDVDVPEGADAVRIDTGGHVVVAGTVMQQRSSRDFTVLSLDADSGAPRWVRMVDGGGRTLDRAFALDVAEDGDVVAAGYTRPARRRLQTAATVMRLDGATGAPRWQRNLYGTSPRATSIGRFFAVRFDHGGDVLATGFLTNAVTARDATLVRFAGDDGAERWRTTLTQPSGVVERFTDDVGLSLDRGPDGAVYVGGVDGAGAAFLARVANDAPADGVDAR